MARNPSLELAGKPLPNPSDPFSIYDPEYQLWGGVAEGFKCRDREYVISGAAGTGKTLSNLLKIYCVCRLYDGARCLIVRKTRESLTETVLPDWEQNVLGDSSPILFGASGTIPQRRTRQSYRFPNGSIVVLGGMDKPNKILSNKCDIVYMPEAIELEKVDWETLGGRCRNYVVPYQQLIADTNPTTPHHWLKKRTEGPNPKCRLIQTTHQDNPRYWDRTAGQWTPEGEDYVRGRLEQMTGHQRTRFLEGIWAAAEGVVYAFRAEPEVDHLTGRVIHPGHMLPDDYPIPANWRRVWGIDWGKSSPTSLTVWAVDPQGRMILIREIYQTHLRKDILGQQAGGWIERGEEPKPQAILCDHDTGNEGYKEIFEKASGLRLRLADKVERKRGIEETQARFDLAADGRPRILFKHNTLYNDPDRTLQDIGHPTCLVEELVSYVWNPKALKDEPIEDKNHAMDGMKYSVCYVNKYMQPGASSTYSGNP